MRRVAVVFRPFRCSQFIHTDINCIDPTTRRISVRFEIFSFVIQWESLHHDGAFYEGPLQRIDHGFPLSKFHAILMRTVAPKWRPDPNDPCQPLPLICWTRTLEVTGYLQRALIFFSASVKSRGACRD